jgi:hypothetical protein
MRQQFPGHTPILLDNLRRQNEGHPAGFAGCEISDGGPAKKIPETRTFVSRTIFTGKIAPS